MAYGGPGPLHTSSPMPVGGDHSLLGHSYFCYISLLIFNISNHGDYMIIMKIYFIHFYQLNRPSEILEFAYLVQSIHFRKKRNICQTLKLILLYQLNRPSEILEIRNCL